VKPNKLCVASVVGLVGLSSLGTDWVSIAVDGVATIPANTAVAAVAARPGSTRAHVRRSRLRARFSRAPAIRIFNLATANSRARSVEP